MMNKLILLLLSVLSAGAVMSQTVLINRPASFPLDDSFSTVSTESDRFGDITYIFPADLFTIEEEVTLSSAEFYGEKIIGSFDDLSALSVFIMPHTTGDVPSLNPMESEPLINLWRILPGEGFEVIYENSNDEMDVAVDFTLANGGAPIVLAPGDYWMCVVAYSPDAGAGDPTLSWQWRFSPGQPSLSPKLMRHTTMAWNSVEDAITATAMAWKLEVESATSIEENILSDVSVYPNPTSDYLQLELLSEKVILACSLIDLLGNRSSVEFHGRSVDLSSTSAGVYFLEVRTTLGIFGQKVVVQN